MLIKTNDLFLQLVRQAKNILTDFSPFYLQLSEPKVVIESLEVLAIKYKDDAENINLVNPFQMVNSAVLRDWQEMLNQLRDNSFKWVIDEALLEVKENLQDLADSKELDIIRAELRRLNETKIQDQHQDKVFATIDDLACFLTDMTNDKTRLDFITHYQGDLKHLIPHQVAYECLLACFEDASVPFLKQLRFNLSHLSANTSQMGLLAAPNLSAQTHAEKDKPNPSSPSRRN